MRVKKLLYKTSLFMSFKVESLCWRAIQLQAEIGKPSKFYFHFFLMLKPFNGRKYKKIKWPF